MDQQVSAENNFVRQCFRRHFCRDRSGFVTLLSVLMVGAIGVTIATSLLLLGIDATRASRIIEKSHASRALADACADRALNALRLSLSYSGGESMTLGAGTCQILAVGGSGNTMRTLQTIGTVQDVTRKVEIEILQVRPRIQIVSWQEVADF